MMIQLSYHSKVQNQLNRNAYLKNIHLENRSIHNKNAERQ